MASCISLFFGRSIFRVGKILLCPFLCGFRRYKITPDAGPADPQSPSSIPILSRFDYESQGGAVFSHGEPLFKGSVLILRI